MEFKEDIRKEYEKELPKYKQAMDEVLFILDNALRNTSIKIHSTPGRIKTLDSILQKAESKEITDKTRCFEEITDIIGIRTICLFLPDIAEIANIIRTNFEVIEEDNKINNGNFSDFGYLSSHFLCRIKNEYNGPRYNGIKDCVFEIQVRTISMDAWANMSHYLDYKSDLDIPTELRRDFFALSGLFYVADTHFEMFFKNKKAQSVFASASVVNESVLEINYETVLAYINKKFSNRGNVSAEAVSDLIQDLHDAEIYTINDLKLNIENALSNHWPIARSAGYNRVGIVRLLLEVSNNKFKEVREKKNNQSKEKTNKVRNELIKSKLPSLGKLPPLQTLPPI